ncbi:MAG: hypothetical protein AB7Q17_03610 [Phycisphaerae bacterium]
MKWTRAWIALSVAGAIAIGCVSESPESLLSVGTDKDDATALPFETATKGGSFVVPPVRDVGFGGGNVGGANVNSTNGNYNGDGTNGNDNGGTNGNDNGVPNGNDNGVPNANDNGVPNGNDNGVPNANDNGVPNANDNGVPNANDNGVPNANDNGVPNANDNGVPNANDNGVPNANDNGVPNANDNGVPNANDNGGTNGNDNGGGGNCADGSTQLRGGFSDGGRAEYRLLVAGCERFRVRTEAAGGNQTLAVAINGVVVGSLTTDSRGRGELEYNTGGFPANFPVVMPGDVVTVGSLSTVLGNDCSSNANCNG